MQFGLAFRSLKGKPQTRSVEEDPSTEGKQDRERAKKQREGETAQPSVGTNPRRTCAVVFVARNERVPARDPRLQQDARCNGEQRDEMLPFPLRPSGGDG